MLEQLLRGMYTIHAKAWTSYCTGEICIIPIEIINNTRGCIEGEIGQCVNRGVNLQQPILMFVQ